MSKSSEPGGRRRITQSQKVETGYLLIKTRSRWRWLVYPAGAAVAGAAGWLLWRLLSA